MINFKDLKNKEYDRVFIRCGYCDSSYFMPVDIIGNAILNHYKAYHPERINKEPEGVNNHE